MPALTLSPFSAAELMDICDVASGELSLTRRMLLLLSASCREPLDVVASLSIGARDRLLLTLREWIFGPRLTLLSACPACGDSIESTLRVAEIRTPERSLSAEDLTFVSGDLRIAFRLPDSADLESIEGANSVSEASELLLQRCVPAHRELTPQVTNEVSVYMGEVDPQADVRLAFECPACSHAWNAPFDIASFLWTEIQAWAHRMLRDVHSLATAYGWSEHDILHLSATRRQAYLGMVSGD